MRKLDTPSTRKISQHGFPGPDPESKAAVGGPIFLTPALMALAALGAWILTEHRNDGYPGDVDGATLQEKLLELGLLEERTVTEPCCETCTCAEVADFPLTCNFLSEGTRAVVERLLTWEVRRG